MLRRRRPGACTFAERPERAAPDALILWTRERDPGTLALAVAGADADDPAAVDLAALRPWMRGVRDNRTEHIVLSDGFRRLRLDVSEGTLLGPRRVKLEARLDGRLDAPARLDTLDRLADLLRSGAFPVAAEPDRETARLLLALRWHDARAQGASPRDFAALLFGAAAVETGWRVPSDHLRSRVRRLMRHARQLAAGGYRRLMQDRESR